MLTLTHKQNVPAELWYSTSKNTSHFSQLPHSRLTNHCTYSNVYLCDIKFHTLNRNVPLLPSADSLPLSRLRRNIARRLLQISYNHWKRLKYQLQYTTLQSHLEWPPQLSLREKGMLKQNRRATPNTGIFLPRFLTLLKMYYGKQMRAGNPQAHARTHISHTLVGGL
jgi:hypothetical protein